MTDQVRLQSITLYDVDEIHIDNDPEKGSGVYLTFLSNNNETKFSSELKARKVSASHMTCFSFDDSGEPPKVFVDGTLIEPNPVIIEEESEDA